MKKLLYLFLNILPDKQFLKLKYFIKMHKKLNLDNPQTFNEKLQWLKLYNRNPEYTKMVDKYEVKKYVANIIGEEYIIPTIGIFDKFDDIDFNKLPNQFVMKCTHDSGGLVIVKDKSKLDKEAAKKKINECLKTNYYYFNREWPYKNVKPRIIVEKYMIDKRTNEFRDYKFYCFNGYAHALLLASNRQSKTNELTFDYFDNKFNHLNLTNYWHPNSKNKLEKPLNFEKMVEIASNISKGFPHVRVDLYEADGKIYFGELTFYDMGGYLKINPPTWEKEWGDFIDLEIVRKQMKK